MNCGRVHGSLRPGLHASFRANSFHPEKGLEKNSLSFHAGALHFSRLHFYKRTFHQRPFILTQTAITGGKATKFSKTCYLKSWDIFAFVAIFQNCTCPSPPSTRHTWLNPCIHDSGLLTVYRVGRENCKASVKKTSSKLQVTTV